MKNSKISWTDHTFNPWRNSPRKRASEAYWKQPVVWNENGFVCKDCGTAYAVDCECGQLGACGEFRRQRVFCGSLCDWLDDEVPVEWLADLLELIVRTPNLDLLMLSKRPQNFKERMKAVRNYGLRECGNGSVNAIGGGLAAWMLNGNSQSNVWIGTSVEDQERLEARADDLVSIPAKIHFISAEPLLGPLDFEGDVGGVCDWLIVGGETGPRARPMNPEWARSLRDQCAAAGVPFFFKQWGKHIPVGQTEGLLDGVQHHNWPKGNE